jgi:hypothetical protein
VPGVDLSVGASKCSATQQASIARCASVSQSQFCNAVSECQLCQLPDVFVPTAPPSLACAWQPQAGVAPCLFQGARYEANQCPVATGSVDDCATDETIDVTPPCSVTGVAACQSLNFTECATQTNCSVRFA